MRLSKEQLIQKIKQTLKQVGTSQMSQSPYDLGWLLRLPAGRHGLPDPKNPKKPRYPQIIFWLEKLQHKDGSWGGAIPFAHDRVISTLSVIAGLSRWPLDKIWRGRIAKAIKAVEINSKKLLKEPEATVAFELLFPKLLNDCEKAGVKIKIPARVLNYYSKLKKEKLSKLPIEAATKQPTTLLHALEALDDNIDFRLFAKFQSPGGSFGCSPASTAFMLAKGLGGPKAERYLDALVKKRVVPPVQPIDLFERAWCLFPIYLFGLENYFSRELKPHIKYLQKYWTDNGVGWSIDLPVSDLDDTSLVFYVLQKNKKKRKIINYLSRAQTNQGFWNDKWHISPYYATSRAILALAGYPETEPMVNKATQWILKTQHKNGLWGFGKGTVEETAYALSALHCINQDINGELKKAFIKGAMALRRNKRENSAQMWIEKSLFAPTNINKFFIIGARLL